MSNKNVVTLFVVGIALMLAAFWAGLNVIRNKARGDSVPSQSEQQARVREADDGTPRTAEEPGKTRYLIQVAAFGTDVQADKLTTDLRKKYRSAYTQPPVPGKEDTLYRVNIGPYDTREAAEQVATELSSEGRKGITIIIQKAQN
jgi:cell division septation protein DedD